MVNDEASCAASDVVKMYMTFLTAARPQSGVMSCDEVSCTGCAADRRTNVEVEEVEVAARASQLFHRN